MKFKTEKMSIIVPACVRSEKALIYTKICVNYILRNSDYIYELILVNDGGDERVGLFFENIKKTLEKISLRCEIITNKPNKGLPHVLNQGIEVSTGDYIAEIDNDCVIPMEWMSTLINYLKNNLGIGMVSGLDFLAEVRLIILLRLF